MTHTDILDYDARETGPTASHSGPFTARGKVLRSHDTGGSVDLRAGLGVAQKRKLSLLEIKVRTSQSTRSQPVMIELEHSISRVQVRSDTEMAYEFN